MQNWQRACNIKLTEPGDRKSDCYDAARDMISKTYCPCKSLHKVQINLFSSKFEMYSGTLCWKRQCKECMWFSNKAKYCLVSTIDFCLSDADWTDPTQRQSEVEMPVKLQIIVSACSLLSAVYCLFRKKLPKTKNSWQMDFAGGLSSLEVSSNENVLPFPVTFLISCAILIRRMIMTVCSPSWTDVILLTPQFPPTTWLPSDRLWLWWELRCLRTFLM